MTNYKRKFLITFLPGIILFQALFYLSSCSTQKYISSVSYGFKSENGKPDYGNLNYWAANPYKYDPSENVPYTFKDERRDILADVFFIYPTSYTIKKCQWDGMPILMTKKLTRKRMINQSYTRRVYLINIAEYLHHDTDRPTSRRFTQKMKTGRGRT
jgi:hypothetical protein